MPFPAAPIRRTRFEQVFGPAWIGKDRRQLAVSQGDAMVIEGAFEPVVGIGCHLRPSLRLGGRPQGAGDHGRNRCDQHDA